MLQTIQIGHPSEQGLIELCTPRQIEPIDGIYFSEMFFADDTLIFGAGARCINAGARCINVLLHAIERHSEYFGLKLNYDKCINITANQRVSSVCFPPTGPGQGKLVPIEKVLQLTLAQFYPIHSVIRQNF